MSEMKSRGFLLKQRAFLKLYLLEYIQKNKRYGSQYLNELRNQFKPYGYVPSHSEVYKALKDLTAEGILRREKQILGDPEVSIQEIVYYQLTEEGKQKADLYKQQMKTELERCVALLQKALYDHYRP